MFDTEINLSCWVDSNICEEGSKYKFSVISTNLLSLKLSSFKNKIEVLNNDPIFIIKTSDHNLTITFINNDGVETKSHLHPTLSKRILEYLINIETTNKKVKPKCHSFFRNIFLSNHESNARYNFEIKPYIKYYDFDDNFNVNDGLLIRDNNLYLNAAVSIDNNLFLYMCAVHDKLKISRLEEMLEICPEAHTLRVTFKLDETHDFYIFPHNYTLPHNEINISCWVDRNHSIFLDNHTEGRVKLSIIENNLFSLRLHVFRKNFIVATENNILMVPNENCNLTFTFIDYNQVETKTRLPSSVSKGIIKYLMNAQAADEEVNYDCRCFFEDVFFGWHNTDLAVGDYKYRENVIYMDYNNDFSANDGIIIIDSNNLCVHFGVAIYNNLFLSKYGIHGRLLISNLKQIMDTYLGVKTIKVCFSFNDLDNKRNALKTSYENTNKKPCLVKYPVIFNTNVNNESKYNNEITQRNYAPKKLLI